MRGPWRYWEGPGASWGVLEIRGGVLGDPRGVSWGGQGFFWGVLRWCQGYGRGSAGVSWRGATGGRRTSGDTGRGYWSYWGAVSGRGLAWLGGTFGGQSQHAVGAAAADHLLHDDPDPVDVPPEGAAAFQRRVPQQLRRRPQALWEGGRGHAQAHPPPHTPSGHTHHHTQPKTPPPRTPSLGW